MSEAEPMRGSERSGAALSRAWILVALIAYGLLLVLASRSLTVFDDEASVIALARNDASKTLEIFLSGKGQHEHPPLYDLVLHAWLPFTGGEPWLLRLPTVVFYCTALWLIGATAELLWRRRLLGVLLGAAWPLGFFFGTPAYWSGLAILGVAGATWSYFAWRQSARLRFLAAFVGFGVALVYTNYMGWVFLAGLGLHLLLTRPGARALGQAAAAGLLVLAAYAPMLAVFLRQLQSGTYLGRSLFLLLGDGIYLVYALLVSESVAPWHWPALIAIAGILALAYVSVRTPKMLWLLGLLVLPYISSVVLGIMNNRRLSLFGPWLILYLTGLLACTRLRRTAAVALLLVFGTGWAGIVTQRWYATFRHIEPWEEIASTTLELARPGDLILSNHPSFYFYVARQLGWKDWREPIAMSVLERSGLVFAGQGNWQQAVPGRSRVIYVRGAMNTGRLAEEERMADFLAANFQQTFERRYIEDTGADMKNRFVANQPRWRIELRRYERAEPAGSR